MSTSDDQKIIDLCRNLSRGYKEKRKKEQTNENRHVTSIHDVCEPDMINGTTLMVDGGFTA